MAATTGYRTVYPALIPPGAKHVDAVNSAAAVVDAYITARIGATLSSLVVDFLVRASGISHLRPAGIERLAAPMLGPTTSQLEQNYLRLNCLTEAYAPLWEELMGEKWGVDTPRWGPCRITSFQEAG